MRQLFAMSAPDALVRALAQARADGQLGEVGAAFVHVWRARRDERAGPHAVAQRRIVIEPGEEFRVEPPAPRG